MDIRRMNTIYFSSLNNSIEELVLGISLPYEQKRKYGIAVNSRYFNENNSYVRNDIWFISSEKYEIRRHYYPESGVVLFSVGINELEKVDILRHETEGIPAVVLLELGEEEYNAVKKIKKGCIEFPFCSSRAELSELIDIAVLTAENEKCDILIPFSQQINEEYSEIIMRNAEEEKESKKIVLEKQVKEQINYVETIEKICIKSKAKWHIKGTELFILTQYGEFDIELNSGDIYIIKSTENDKKLCIQCSEESFLYSNSNNLKNILNLSKIFAIANNLLPESVLRQILER